MNCRGDPAGQGSIALNQEQSRQHGEYAQYKENTQFAGRYLQWYFFDAEDEAENKGGQKIAVEENGMVSPSIFHERQSEQGDQPKSGRGDYAVEGSFEFIHIKRVKRGNGGRGIDDRPALFF